MQFKTLSHSNEESAVVYAHPKAEPEDIENIPGGARSVPAEDGGEAHKGPASELPGSAVVSAHQGNFEPKIMFRQTEKGLSFHLSILK